MSMAVITLVDNPETGEVDVSVTMEPKLRQEDVDKDGLDARTMAVVMVDSVASQDEIDAARVS